MISVILCQVSQPSLQKRKSYDETFVTAKSARIKYGATLMGALLLTLAKSIYYYFYIQEILPGTIALAFRFAFAFRYLSSSLFCHYYRFFPSLYYHTFYSKLCFSFSGMRSCLFVVASWPMFFIALFLWFITRAF